MQGRVFRDRVAKLGDIVSSAAVFVGKPAFAYSDTLESQPYSAFVTANANQPKIVYVGGNDGMLHGLDAHRHGMAGLRHGACSAT